MGGSAHSHFGFGGREQDRDNMDDDEGSPPQQFSAWDEITECLHRHECGMGKARACREGNQAAIRRWGTRCQQQENPESGIDAKHHRQRRLLPDNHQQGINSSHKEQSHHDQYYLQRPFSTHGALLLNHVMGKRHTAYSLITPPSARHEPPLLVVQHFDSLAVNSSRPLHYAPYNKRGHMSSTKNTGRFAGLLYVLMSIPGFFAMGYVPGKLIVHGNAAATASNISASETLFRLGLATQLIGMAGFIFVALALYDLLKGVNRRHASLVGLLIVVSVPIAFLNQLNSMPALVLVRGADFLSKFDKPQRDALAMLFLRFHGP